MAPLDIVAEHDTSSARVVVGGKEDGKAHVLHCNYYNTYLLRTIWKDASGFVDSESILMGAAAEQAYFQLTALFVTHGVDRIEDRKTLASRFYAWQGFGLLDFGPILSQGGVTRSSSQHYAQGWREQFGKSDEPVGFMTRGWLAGAAAAIYGHPHGFFSAHQPECAAVTGGSNSVFELRPDGANYALFNGRGVGPLTDAVDRVDGLTGNIDAPAVARAVATLPLFGATDRDGGLIHAFDVQITWHPHQYYDRISVECVRQATEKFGVEGRLAVEPLLEEAGHRCAFRTFGGIWRSAEWEAVVEPMCQTPEDWIHGMVAIINCVGWGRVQCSALSQDEAVFIVHDDYESVGYLNLYGTSESAPIYLLKGGFRGMMNLVYNAQMPSKPALTEALYESMCRREGAYETRIEKCRAMGDDVSVFRVKRKS